MSQRNATPKHMRSQAVPAGPTWLMTGTDRALFSAISDAAQPFEVAGGGVQPWD